MASNNDYGDLALGKSRNDMCPIVTNRRIFFSLFYNGAHGKTEFLAASTTWQKEIMDSENFDASKDIFISRPIVTTQDFNDSWKAVSVKAKEGYEVWCGQVFSHGSTIFNGFRHVIRMPQLKSQGGIELTPSVSSSGTLGKNEILSLPRLPWNDKYGFLILSGCYTGVKEGRGWSPAEVFATSQGIPTVGQRKSAHFSVSFPSLVFHHGKHSRLYLWSYDSPTLHEVFSSGAYLATGQSGGLRLPGAVFTP